MLDTLTEKVKGTAGEDIAVLLLGYRGPMLKMIRNQNEGLAGRFNTANALSFEDYSGEDLLLILSRACQKDEIRAPFHVKRFAIQKLSKLRALPNFCNARLVQQGLEEAKRRMNKRLAQERSMDAAYRPAELQQCDFEDQDSSQRNKDPLHILNDLQDIGNFKEKLLNIGSRMHIRNIEGRGREGLVGNYIFTGAPGTGKTTVARQMARILHGFDILATDHVEITSAEDLCAGYAGQTKTVVEEKMKAARGGVLFIDEAYELGNGPYGKEAMTKLLSMLTEEEYQDNMIVILAGYEKEMHQMLTRNPGMKSRFSEYLHFPDWNPQDCTNFIRKLATQVNPSPYVLGKSVDEGMNLETKLTKCFETLAERPGWANARDVFRLFNDIEKARETRLCEKYCGSNSMDGYVIQLQDVVDACNAFLESRPAVSCQEVFPIQLCEPQSSDQVEPMMKKRDRVSVVSETDPVKCENTTEGDIYLNMLQNSLQQEINDPNEKAALQNEIRQTELFYDAIETEQLELRRKQLELTDSCI